jgi:hypothetical protein
MIIFLTKAWVWIKDHWKLTIASLTGLAIFIFGYVKGSKGKKRAEALRDLAEKDSEGYKKNKEDYAEGVQGLVTDYSRERDEIEEKKKLALEEAKERAKEKKEELENDSKKLDRILKDDYDLDGR